MLGVFFLVIGLVGFGVGMTERNQYQRSPSHEPMLLGTSVLWFLSSAANLVAATAAWLLS